MTSIAIMQPTFSPWVGYFDLIDQADHFVYLDTVEFSKQSWQQRNKIKGAGGPSWLSLPVTYSKTLKTTISEATVGNLNHFKKTITTVQHAYSKANYAESNLMWILDWLANVKEGQLLSDLNVEFIEVVCNKFKISTPRILASKVPHKDNRHERLIDICLSLNATQYISPPGAFDYMQEDISHFKQAGIDVVFHQYNHPVYRQMHGEFASHMSVIDLILNEGEASMSILKEGRMKPKKYDDF
tara:strand:+ start:2106 stop:2831 length:726 start_codon:yes stop_codon:yes gene_type:complete